MKADISLNDMKRVIKSAKKFIDNTKNTIGRNLKMKLIYIKVEGMELTATILDGHKIVREHVNIITSDGDFTCYIKPELPKGIDQVCTIERDGEYSFVSVEDYVIRCKQLEGEYYKVDDILNREVITDHCIGFRTKILKDAINAISSDQVIIYYKNPKEGIYIKNTGNELKTEMYILPINIGVEG